MSGTDSLTGLYGGCVTYQRLTLQKWHSNILLENATYFDRGGLICLFTFSKVMLNARFFSFIQIIWCRKWDYRLKCIRGSIYILYYISLIFLNPDIYTIKWSFINIRLVFLSFPHSETHKKTLNAQVRVRIGIKFSRVPFVQMSNCSQTGSLWGWNRLLFANWSQFLQAFTACFVQILKLGAKIILGFKVGVISALQSSFITIINLSCFMRRHGFHDIITSK